MLSRTSYGKYLSRSYKTCSCTTEIYCYIFSKLLQVPHPSSIILETIIAFFSIHTNTIGTMTVHVLIYTKLLILNFKFSVTIATERAKNKSNNNLEANEDANETT